MIDKQLGQILIEKEIISQGQLDLALKHQKEGENKYLGQILFDMGVPQDQINKVLDYHNKRKKIGQILIDLNVITPVQLEEAIEKQKQLQEKNIRMLLGKLLIEMGYINYDNLLEALSRHFNMPIISLEDNLCSSVLQKEISQKYAIKNKVVVSGNNEKFIQFALGEPTFYVLEELQKAFEFSKRVEFYLAKPSEIETCLQNSFYHS